jgi:branched-subunit amino acid transport protein
VRYPPRDTQLEYCRYGFIATYILTGALLSAVLINIGPKADPWVANIVLDCILAVVFYIYCKNVHIQEVSR